MATQPPLPLGVLLPPLHHLTLPWAVERVGYNAMRVQVVPGTTLTREQAFRLIGELERVAVTL